MFPFSPQTQSCLHPHLGRLILTCNYKSVIVIRGREQIVGIKTEIIAHVLSKSPNTPPSSILGLEWQENQHQYWDGEAVIGRSYG